MILQADCQHFQSWHHLTLYLELFAVRGFEKPLGGGHPIWLNILFLTHSQEVIGSLGTSQVSVSAGSHDKLCRKPMETPSRQDHSYVSSQTLVQFLGPSDALKRSTFPCGDFFFGGWYGHTVDGTNPAPNGKYLLIYRVSYMSAGAGFFPSTALALYNLHLSRCMWWYIFNFRVLDFWKFWKVPTFSAKSSLFWKGTFINLHLSTCDTFCISFRTSSIDHQ